MGLHKGGYDFFDAIAGAPGTYITHDMYGHMGFGFSEELWQATQAYKDGNETQNQKREEKAKVGSIVYSNHLTDGFVVYIDNFGGDQIVSGLIPELAALAQEQKQSVAATVPTYIQEQVNQLVQHGIDFGKAFDTVLFNAILNNDDWAFGYMNALSSVMDLGAHIAELYTPNSYKSAVLKIGEHSYTPLPAP